MSIDVKRYEELKSDVEEAQQKVQRAKGSIDELMKRLKQEFGCNTVAEAEKKLVQLKKQSDTLEAEFDKKMKKFEADYADKLE